MLKLFCLRRADYAEAEVVVSIRRVEAVVVPISGTAGLGITAPADGSTIITVPRKLRIVLGDEGTEGLIEMLNQQ